jgi:ATP-dependent Clp protease ATP-binding subunit ClpC
VDIELTVIKRRIDELGYRIILSDKAKSFLADKGYDVQFGARPLKRALQTYVEDEVSELLLDGVLQQGDSIIVDHEDGSGKLTYSVKNNE